jgi:GGDEF domain-containing protein
MKLSVSYGSAVYHSNKDKSYDDVYRRADKRMYEMKNRIHAKRKH